MKQNALFQRLFGSNRATKQEKKQVQVHVECWLSMTPLVTFSWRTLLILELSEHDVKSNGACRWSAGVIFLIEAFLVGTEFAHLHSADEGSLHLTLPDSVRKQALDGGWRELHPLADQTIQGFYATPNACLIFGPRTEDELSVVWQFVQASYAFARGKSVS